MTIEELLAESIEEARLREKTTFVRRTEPLVLFGAGTLGRKMLAALRESGLEPVAFADNNSALHGSKVNGVEVLSPSYAADRWGHKALFVVTIFQPLDKGLNARLRWLESLGCENVISFLPLAWSLENILPHFGAERPSSILRESSTLRHIAEIWSDVKSREIFRQQLMWRLRADFSAIEAPSPNQYFPDDILKPGLDEAFVDGGAFDGDTFRSMPWSPARIWAIEPDPVNLRILKSQAGPSVTICETALGREQGKARFNASGTMASARSESGSIEVQISTLDALLAEAEPTFIKLDVEGEEFAALEGARELLKRSQPVVAVCVYHKPEDLWTIPVFLKNELPNHKFALRSHAHDGFELVAYAIPTSRFNGC